MRPDWDSYFMEIAGVVAKRSPDSKRKVGCVLVSHDKRIISTGYNGLPAGMSEEGVDWMNKPAKDALVIHAEQNALIYSDFSRLRGGTAYVTTAPCIHCAKMLANSGISRLVCGEVQVDSGLDILRLCGVEVVCDC